MTIEEQFAQVNAKLDHLAETMRDMQAEILRGFGTWAANQSLRVNKLEADHRALDTSATQRLENIEISLLDLEKRKLADRIKLQ